MNCFSAGGPRDRQEDGAARVSCLRPTGGTGFDGWSTMSSPPPSSRSRFLAQVGWGAGALAGAAWGIHGGRRARADAGSRATAFDPDVEVSLKATPSKARMLPGDPTDVWTFQGRVVRGDP